MRIKPIFLWLMLSLTVVVSFSAPAAAQNARENAEEEADKKRELSRKTYALIDEIASGASSLRLPENRSYVLAAAAELLWEHNEKRARNLFWDAINTLQLVVHPGADPAAKKSAKAKSANQENYRANFAMRRELLRRISRRDPQLAIDMFRATQQPLLQPVHAESYAPDERELEQQLAADAASRDPKRVLEIARESLARGITFQLYEVLSKLNDRDGELGTKFAVEIIDKLQTRNLATDLQGSRIAVDMLLMSRAPAKATRENQPTWESRPLKLLPEQRRELVNMIANAALGLSANGDLLFTVSEIKPEIEEFAPERIALLEKKLAAFRQTLNKEQRGWLEFNSLVQNGTPEDMLRGAGNAGDDERRMLQQQAIELAVRRKRIDALREFINAEIKEESQRNELIDALDSQQINLAVDRGSTEELRKLLSQVRLKEERARAMAEIAVLLEKNGEHDRAVELLSDARALVKIDFESESQSHALLALVAAYAVVDPDKAFAIIEKTVDRANDQLSKALLMDRIVKTGLVRKGEIVLQGSGPLPLDFALFKYGRGMAALGNADFDRTKALADRFDRNEVRLVARLLLARALAWN